MRKLMILAIAALAVMAGPRTADAQSGSCDFLCSPFVIAQPGYLLTNAVQQEPMNSEFQVRLATAIPTGIPRTTLGVLVQWRPFRETGGGFGQNAVTFGYAAVVNVLAPQMTDGLLTFDFVPIGAMSPAALGENQAYTHKFVFEGNTYFHVGKMLPRDAPALLQSTSIHALTAYVASGIPEQADPWAFQLGLSVPIAPFPR